MKVEQSIYEKGKWSVPLESMSTRDSADLVFVFGTRAVMEDESLIKKVNDSFPKAIHLGCSSSGEIYSTRIMDNTLVVTAVSFESTKVKSDVYKIKDMEESYEAGKKLAKSLMQDDLVHVFVLSEGLNINGSELVRGFTDTLPSHVAVTGGLAGDGGDFKKTLVYCDGHASPGLITAVGFYGKNLKVGYGSVGGWDPFGPVRQITKSEGNKLYELDSQPALDLYKTYLGDKAKELPGSALHFPLSMRRTKDSEPVVRTVLSIDEGTNTMVLAGDVPEGAYVQFMKANFDRLVDGAAQAATNSGNVIGSEAAELAILISCVGRRFVLKQATEEETEAVENILGKGTKMTGFYSYGEISPATPHVKCELHNQTMTITTFAER
jgi:hypothetical protein